MKMYEYVGVDLCYPMSILIIRLTAVKAPLFLSV